VNNLNTSPPARRRFSLGFVWLHWVVVNAATVGLFAAVISALEKFGAPPASRGLVESLGLLLILPAYCLLVELQKHVLREAGLKFGYWGLATFAGSVIACFPSLIIATIVIQVARLILVSSSEFTGMAAGHFAFGVIVGGLQTTQFQRTSGQYLMWTCASGIAALGMGSVALIEDYVSLRSIGPTMTVTVLGAIYGAVTGAALVWILKQNDEV
jgi:hypothetical protein